MRVTSGRLHGEGILVGRASRNSWISLRLWNTAHGCSNFKNALGVRVYSSIREGYYKYDIHKYNYLQYQVPVLYESSSCLLVCSSVLFMVQSPYAG